MTFLTSSGTILLKTKTTAVSEPAYEVMWQVTMDLSRRAQNLSALCQHFLYLNYMPKNLHHSVVAKPTPVAFGVVILANLQRSFQIPTLRIYLWMLIRLKMHPVTPNTQAHILQRAERGVTHFEISDWLFFSPSTVNGDAPVSSSKVNTPRDHQSTVCREQKKRAFTE